MSSIAVIENGIARLKWLAAATRFEVALLRHGWALKAGYDPSQTRNELGRWTDIGGGLPRLASSDRKPTLGRAAVLEILAQTGRRLIEAYRSDNMLRDLFGRDDKTVSWTNLDGRDIFGSSSKMPSYSRDDAVAAEKMRETLVEKYPGIMRSDNIGWKPNDALYHAEANLLMRAAKANGGDLSGKNLEVVVDRSMCGSCATVLPLVSRELGNPTVTFIGPNGVVKMLRNGDWVR